MTSDVHDGILVQAPLPASMGRQRRAAGLRCHQSGQGRRRLQPGERRPPGAGPCPPRAVHAIGRDRDAGSLRSGASPADTPWSSAAVKSSGSRWPCCCCSAMPPSPSAIRKRRTCRGWHASADILVAAIGRAGFVTRRFRETGCDGDRCGHQSRDRRVRRSRRSSARFEADGDFERRGSAVVGDVHPNVAEVAGALTPVPGGVGPLTIAILLRTRWPPPKDAAPRS